MRLQELGLDRFRSLKLLPNMNGHIFGGQLIANALSAAMLTVPQRPPHMMQVFFLRPGTLKAPLELSVHRVRDGVSMSHRRVELSQSDKLVLTAEVSFHDGRAGPEHQSAPPKGISLPEDLEELGDLVLRHGERISPRTRERILVKRAFLVKPLDPEAAVVSPSSNPRLTVWMKPTLDLPKDPLLQYAAVAMMSDLWLPASVRSMHVPSLFDESAMLLSLNHGLWFHQAPSAEDWLLYVLESPIAQQGRGVGRGLMYDRSGRLIASAIQEALML